MKIEKHGMTGTKQYNIFKGIQTRCKFHKDYKGRNIICEWKTFEDFWKDMGSSYQEGLTIDRIDNNGNYNKFNCKWATMKEQANNRRNNILINYNGKIQNLKQWCECLNIPYKTIYRRYKLGYSIEKCFTKPILKQRNDKGLFV